MNPPWKDWKITIRHGERGGFHYVAIGPGIGEHCGYEPTRERLAAILAQTINEYLPTNQ